MSRVLAVALLALVLCSPVLASQADPILKLPSDRYGVYFNGEDDEGSASTRWAVLIAGSSGFSNYRHQVYRSKAYSLDLVLLLILKVVLELCVCLFISAGHQSSSIRDFEHLIWFAFDAD